MAAGLNWFLYIVVPVMAGLTFVAVLYLVANYMHPEDRNQAWAPKVVVIFSFWLAVGMVLMFPLDVANRAGCDDDVSLSHCQLALPMRQLWLAVYVVTLALVFFCIPFMLFYYEADSELSLFVRLKSSLIWVGTTAIVLAVILGIAYAFVGYVKLPTQALQSGLVAVTALSDLSRCIATSAAAGADGSGNTSKCDALDGPLEEEDWKLRVSFPVYLVAMLSLAGWLLFMVFAGVGMVALPVDLIRSFFQKPKATITRTEYIKRAQSCAAQAKDLTEQAEQLKKEERAAGRKGRQWKQNYRTLSKRVTLLEEEQQELEKLFPQGDDRDTAWTLYVLSFYLNFVAGIVFAVVGASLLLHIVLFLLVSPPASPFLNSLFVYLDETFTLFGVGIFTLYCSYLVLAAIKGHFRLGLSFAFVDLYPMKPGATLMSSFLVNSATMLLTSTAVVQFCASCFAVYANETAIEDIFGNEVNNLLGIKVLFAHNAFIYTMLGVSVLSLVYFSCTSAKLWKSSTKAEAYAAV